MQEQSPRRPILLIVLAVLGLLVGGFLVRALLLAVLPRQGLFFAPSELAHIQLAAEPVAHIGGFVLTNTMVGAWVAIVVLLLFFRAATSKLSLVPGGVQNVAELIIEFLLDFCKNVAGEYHGRRFFPLVATIFLFVITANWLGLVPGLGTIGIWERHVVEGHEELLFVPIFRAATTDLNMTMALALFAVIASQIFGFRTLGLSGYGGKFINLKGGPIMLYVGLLELIGELAKVLSFTFRLFGNIFAGEVLLSVIAFLVPWVAALPFYGLELFVGFVQALVFAALTLIFLTVAVTGHGEEHHEEQASAEHATHSAPAGSH